MLLSIVIPLYNKADTIRSTIESILSQNAMDYEIIVVDDGSTDNGVDIVRSIDSEKINLYQKENTGFSATRNYGVKKAKGNWVLFLDADDRLLPDALEVIYKFIKKKKQIDIFTFGFYVEQNGQLRIDGHVKTNGRIHFPFISFYYGKIFPRTGNTVCKRSIYLEEPYDETLRRYEDYEHDLRLMAKYRYYASKKPIFIYNNNSLAASYRRENYKEDYCCVMKPKGKPILQQLLMYKLYKNETCVNYPELASELYKNEFDMKRIKRWDRMLHRCKQIRHSVLRVF